MLLMMKRLLYMANRMVLLIRAMAINSKMTLKPKMTIPIRRMFSFTLAIMSGL